MIISELLQEWCIVFFISWFKQEHIWNIAIPSLKMKDNVQMKPTYKTSTSRSMTSLNITFELVHILFNIQKSHCLIWSLTFMEWHIFFWDSLTHIFLIVWVKVTRACVWHSRCTWVRVWAPVKRSPILHRKTEKMHKRLHCSQKTLPWRGATDVHKTPECVLSCTSVAASSHSSWNGTLIWRF